MRYLLKIWFADRFEAIPIRPKDVLDNWIAWANSQDDEGLSSIHKLILEFLEKHPDLYYNYSYVEQAYLDSFDENVISTKPYPNYRSWDLLSGYMYECDKLKREYMTLTILGFIGKEAGEPFIDFLQSKGVVVRVSEPEDELDNVVEDAIMSGAPTLLVTSSGCGKSWRVNNVAKKLGAIVLEVNLSTMDRTDVMGMPCKVETKTYIGGQIGDEDLSNQMKDLSNKFKLPSKMTVKAPKSSIVKTFKEAIASGRRVVLLFEEVTRVTNPATMSAVFEAVSDNRIFGVDFDPKQVSILCNANVGEDYEDCQSLDPAYVARFNVYHKVGYTLDDAKSARKFFNENYSAHMNSYFDTKTDGEILQMIKAVEQRAIDESVPSTRAWYDLNLFLNDTNTSSTVKGTILFADKKSQRSIQRVGQASSVQDTSMTKAVDAIDAKIINWSGIGASMSIQVNGETYTGDDLVDLFNTCKDFIRKGDESYLEPMKNIIQMLVYLDNKIVQNRQEAISYIIGESASQDFCSFYNTVSGTDQARIEIPDLKDKALFEAFLDNTLKASGASAVIVNTLTTLMGAIFDYHQFNIPAGHYQHFVLKSLDRLPTPDAIALFTTTIVGDSKLDSMLRYADDNKLDFVKEVAKFMNLDVDDKTWSRIDGTAKDDDIVVTSKRAFI